MAFARSRKTRLITLVHPALAVSLVFCASCGDKQVCGYSGPSCTTLPPNTSEYYVIGFPPAFRGGQAQGGGYVFNIPVATKLTLFMIRLAPGEADLLHPADTVRTATWSVNDAAIATITARTDGSGRADLVAKAPGQLMLVTSPAPKMLLSCGDPVPGACATVGQMVVVP